MHGTYSRLVNSALRDYAEQCFNNWVEKKVEALNDKLEDKSRLWEVVSSKMDKYDIDYDIIYERCVVPKGCLEVKREVEVIDWAGIFSDLARKPMFWVISVVVALCLWAFSANAYLQMSRSHTHMKIERDFNALLDTRSSD